MALSAETRQLMIVGLIGAAAGGVATFIGWKIASKRIDQQFGNAGAALLSSGEAQLRQSIDRELSARIPGMVQTEMRNTLASYGITPDTGRRIDATLRLAERLRII